MDVKPRVVMNPPADLFRHDVGSTSPHVKPEFESLFTQHRQAFWHTCRWHFGRKWSTTPMLMLLTRNAHELMKFLGILFYVALIDKGEYANYWGEQVEDNIFQSQSIRLDPIMSLARFKFIRKNLCFRDSVSRTDLLRDPAARIRPLMNMLKLRASKFVELGRNAAVDESSIACRSRFARHLIVFNATKPTGKYHFKIYMCCCSESWLMANFRLHCASGLRDRHEGVISIEDSDALASVTAVAAEVRKCVAEVTRPIHQPGRIVNTDNYYTSVQLLEMLRVLGLYGRGTIRENSNHYPRCVVVSKKDDLPRGSMKQAVSVTNKIVAASWVDGAVVNIVSNADGSTSTKVHRQVGQVKRPFAAPTCVIEYNKAMQGVDCIDQLRARFSIADGHSFRKWHKKLALAFIDLARCNAYITRKMANGCKSKRDPHREFMVELISGLLSGAWQNSIMNSGMLYTNPTEPDLNILRTPSRRAQPSGISENRQTEDASCNPIHSQVQFPQSKVKRGCVICQFEGRYPTIVTNWCTQHLVPLCSMKYPAQPTKGFVCQEDWTCWKKFHAHYLPEGLFNAKGRIRRSSTLYERSKASDRALFGDTVSLGSPSTISECSTVYV